jgi:hypothetical protein
MPGHDFGRNVRQHFGIQMKPLVYFAFSGDHSACRPAQLFEYRQPEGFPQQVAVMRFEGIVQFDGRKYHDGQFETGQFE